MNDQTFDVPLHILGDEAVEGLHHFTAAVQQSSLVTPWSSANIYIMDNDSECSTITVFIIYDILLNSSGNSRDGSCSVLSW